MKATFEEFFRPFDTTEMMQRSMRRMQEEVNQMDQTFDREFNTLRREMSETQRQNTPDYRSEFNMKFEGSSRQYSYYQHVRVYTGGSSQVVTISSPPVVASPGPSVLVQGLAVTGALLAGAALFLTAKFLKNFKTTLFRESKKWVLAATWPFLLSDPQFRTQFWNAVRGKKSTVREVYGQEQQHLDKLE